MKRLLLIVLSSLLLNIELARAGFSIEIQALFSGKVVALIDGERRVISVGETSPEGVKLIEANPKQAIFEIDGKQQSYTLGSSISLNFVKAKGVEESVFADERGMFLSVGSINGQSVRFLVDTGATTVAMNTTQAKRLGVQYKVKGEVATASTASGFVKAYRVRLKSVSLGKIKRRNVEAMVIDGAHPGPVLLGMSFLSGIMVEKSGNTLKLQSR